MSGKDKTVKVKADIKKKKAALASLQSLSGKAPENMTKAERILYDRTIGQLLNILNTEGKVQI